MNSIKQIKSVFIFTFRQKIKNRSFIFSTFFLALLIFIGITFMYVRVNDALSAIGTDDISQMVEIVGTSSIAGSADADVIVVYSEIKKDNRNILKNTLKSFPFIGVVIIVLFMNKFADQVSAEVASEKNTKLMECLLIMLKPESLVFGKVFATIVSGVLQIAVWICALILGIRMGSIIACVRNPEYVDAVESLLLYVRSFFESNDISSLEIILAVVALIIGISFYGSIAGITGSIVTGDNDTKGASSVYLMMILLSYIPFQPALYTENNALVNVLVMIPSSAALFLPSGLIAGSISIKIAVISIIIQCISIVILNKIAGVAYKSMVFYKGTKPFRRIKRAIIHGFLQ